ncbi:gastrula zinc finger protein XlCGF46.1-like [Chrysoperla carnea]|uniref:gastrula zinc finger protein XlCGF46.1-like n=1 Tax=Chrysoperla carnea TaxID=189513 RepID=UPI001D0867DD|nr:gastrula zinc finger protein XlCGF46.1-like [Chrysoperla carnea]
MATPIINLNDLNNICRICLKKKPNMISIFKKVLSPRLIEELSIVYDLQPYSELVEECTSIKISENDMFPKNLCVFCSKQLVQSRKLKIQCLSSAKTLQNFIIGLDKSAEAKNPIEAIEVVVKQEIIDDFDVSESKINTSYIEQVENSHNKRDDDDKDMLDNSFNYGVITKEEPEEDSKEICNNELNEDDHGDKKYNCQDCTDKFVSKVELTSHYKKLHLKPRIKCEFCSKVYLSLSAFRNHLYHPKNRCKICLKEFECNNEFVSHMKDCITCKKCGERYCHSVHDSHTCLKLQEKPCMLCPCCGKTFAEKWNFEQHMIRHKNERSHQCKICDSKFNTSNLLKVHLIAHTNEKPHECEVCKKSYKYASSLRRHKVSHTNYRIPCNFCDKLWKSKDTLRKHQLVHTGERKFVCTYCSKPFGRYDNLQMHLRIHTGEKPFVCDKCGTGFSAKHVLRGHMKTHER